MDDRIRDRRRSVNRRRGRRRAVPILLLLLVVAAVGVFLWLRSSSVFAVRTVTATATEHVTEQDIATATAPALGVSLLKVSTGSIEKALKALPYVREAHVYRGFPNTLEVRVEEYQPVARLQAAQGDTWLISENGRVLERLTPPRGYTLPLVVPANPVSPSAGDEVPDDVVAALPVVTLLAKADVAAGLPSVKQVTVSVAGQVVLAFADGSELRLGAPTDLEHKLTVAADIIQKNLRDGTQVEYIDVSVPDRAAVKAK